MGNIRNVKPMTGEMPLMFARYARLLGKGPVFFPT